MATTLEKVAQSNLSNTVKKQILESVEKGAVRTIVTNVYGSAVTIGENVAKETAKRITVMTAEEIMAQVTARTGPGAALRVFGIGAKWALGGLGAVAAVGTGVFSMQGTAHAAEIDPFYDMYQALNFLIHQGYTNLAKTESRYTGQDTSDIEIETWRLSESQFSDVIRSVRSLIILQPDEKEHLIMDLKAERSRLTNSEK
jgi:hypothetical protein